MRITADVLQHARAFINPVKDRELDLRGLKIPLIENLGVTQDQFDTIDLSDNEVKRLDNFPRLKRLRTLLLSNNFVERLGQQLGEQIPELEALVLSNNKVKSLSEVDRLAALPKLATLSLVDNPVCKQPHYRAYVLHRLPALKVLDFRKVKADERAQADQLFSSAAGQQLAASVAEEGQALAAQRAAAAEPTPLTEEQKRIAQEMIDSATTPEELDRVERMLRAGIYRVPDKAAPAPAPADADAAAPAAAAAAPAAPAAPAPAAAPASPAKASRAPKAAKAPAPAPAPAAPAPEAQAPPPPAPAPPAPAPQAAEAAQPSPTRQSARQSKRAREAEEAAAEEEPAAKVAATGGGDDNGHQQAPAMETEAPAGGGGETLTAADVDAMKVTELKAALKERGLPTNGLKAELAERLKASLG